ncbi:hypothetical protein V8G54_020637 [Vigna mungo]|uniref:BPL/LPL catalytic domain-containing protein n=1 Tax=Vigna mungo TaxID=3915 RepID=A0AAQ3RWY2_VIGMU
MAVMGKAKEAGLPLMKLIKLRGMPILQQLHLEERLLRTSSDNWCLINDGTNSPAIVLSVVVMHLMYNTRMTGVQCDNVRLVVTTLVFISREMSRAWEHLEKGREGGERKLSELVEVKLVLQDRIPIIKRFTGGGTVVVDHDTIFVTLICNKDAVSNVQPFPRSIMSWSGLLYSEVFKGLADFHLRENDYVFGDRKFGGNAQSITKNRWVHHTSFLWDYDVKNMSYLKLPAKRQHPQALAPREPPQRLLTYKWMIIVNETSTSKQGMIVAGCALVVASTALQSHCQWVSSYHTHEVSPFRALEHAGSLQD